MLWESLRNYSLPPPFTWLPLTTLNPRDYVDHHLLFHLAQIPFTWFGDLRLGAKLASTIFASIAVFSCYWLLVHYQHRYLLVWLVALLASSAPFLYRLNMAKAPPFAIIFLVLGVHCLFKNRYWPLLPLALLFTLTYDMFAALVLAVFIWMAIIAWTERRIEWRAAVCVLVGVAAGLVINPYFPHNLQLLYDHLLMKVTPSDYATKVGQEWYPYDTWKFLGNSVVACVAMVVGYIAFDASDRKSACRPLFFLVFSTVLMILTARWKRIVEYWPPFAVMFAAFALHPWLQNSRSPFGQLPSDVLNELQPFLDRQGTADSAREAEQRELRQVISAAVVAMLLAVVLFLNLRATAKDINASKPHNYYRAGAEWLRANVAPGQIIFNTDWDDFPRLFYFDPSHSYVSGLDPNYLYDKNPTLSRLYDRITLGDQNDPGPLIRDRFGARYIFSDNGHNKFFDAASQSGWFDIVYEDAECTILHIRDQRAEPPADEPDAEAGGGDEHPDDNGPEN